MSWKISEKVIEGILKIVGILLLFVLALLKIVYCNMYGFDSFLVILFLVAIWKWKR
jgi:hypothetical protein